MPSRAEPYLHERLWIHPANLGPAGGITTHFEDGRPGERVAPWEAVFAAAGPDA